MVAPSHATFLSFPLILLSFSEASTMDVSSSCVDPVYYKSFSDQYNISHCKASLMPDWKADAGKAERPTN